LLVGADGAGASAGAGCMDVGDVRCGGGAVEGGGVGGRRVAIDRRDV